MNITDIPVNITNDEEMIRILLSPIHIKGNGVIIPYAFQPPADSQDISVNRRNYTTFEFCENQGTEMQTEKNKFWGLCLVLVKNIRAIGFNVVYTPTEHNPAHSDITIGFIKQKGEPLPIDITLKIKQLIKEVDLKQSPS